jgi:hypothetical protein
LYREFSLRGAFVKQRKTSGFAGRRLLYCRAWNVAIVFLCRCDLRWHAEQLLFTILKKSNNSLRIAVKRKREQKLPK